MKEFQIYEECSGVGVGKMKYSAKEIADDYTELTSKYNNLTFGIRVTETRNYDSNDLMDVGGFPWFFELEGREIE